MFFFFFFIPFTSLYFNTLLTHPPFFQVILSPLSIKTQIEFHQQCTYSFQCLLFKPSTDYWNKCLWIQHPKLWCSQYPGLSVPYSKDTFLYLNSDTHGHSFIVVITSYCNLSISQIANIPFSALKLLFFYFMDTTWKNPILTQSYSIYLCFNTHYNWEISTVMSISLILES